MANLSQNALMSLQDVTRTAVLQAIDEFDVLGKPAFLERYGFGPARAYFILHNGQEYDSKAVVGAAHGVARPDLGPLRATDFSGGEATVGQLLERLGFEVSGPETSSRAKRNPAWTRDELILALDHYLKNPTSPYDPHSAAILTLTTEIRGIARLLNLTGSETLRNANGVSMKLLNFRAHDPVYRAKGQTGLSRGNKLEAELWAQFAEDPERLNLLAAAIRARLENPDVDLVDAVSGPDEPEVAEAQEGRLITRLHRTRERDRSIVKRKKESFRRRHGKLCCEACGFDFASRYGTRGADFIECHHTQPIALLKPGETTKLDDLILLCANCHRIVHVRSPWLTMDELKAILGHVR